MKDEKPWVGDEVRDEATGRTGIITDVRKGTYILRPLHGPGEWTAENHEKLAVTVPLVEPRTRRRR